jgi:hypothetical protein
MDVWPVHEFPDTILSAVLANDFWFASLASRGTLVLWGKMLSVPAEADEDASLDCTKEALGLVAESNAFPAD